MSRPLKKITYMLNEYGKSVEIKDEICYDLDT